MSLLAIILLSLTVMLNAQTTTIQVDTTQSLGPVNRMVLGQVVRGADRKDVFGTKHDAFICNEAEGMWDPRTRSPKPNALARLMAIHPPVLRYPGGLVTQGHDWEKTIGPVEARPDFQFGLNEYLSICKTVGAQPQIVLSEYIATPQDLANLIEYLNMPASAQYPWAMKRKDDGYPEPYHVTLFELGNETWTKKLSGRGRSLYSAHEYGVFYQQVQKAIKAVDPSVKLGLVLANYGHRRFDDPWNIELLGMVGKQADFVITHAYAVGYRGNAQNDQQSRILNSCMAVTEQIESWLGKFNGLIDEKTGRHIPIALTEFNASFVGNPYRFSYAAALHSADFVRMMLKPQYHIMLANYWHFLNGHFGMVQGEQDSQLLNHPAYPLMRLWGEHFKGTQVASQVQHGPTINARSFLRTLAASGSKYEPSLPISQDNLFIPKAIKGRMGKDLQWELTADGQFAMRLDGRTQPGYPRFAEFPIAKDMLSKVGEFRVTCEMQYVADPGSGLPGHIGLGIEDARGWTATHSASAMSAGDLTGRWHTIVGEYLPLPGTTAIGLLARLNIGGKSISGTLHIRNIRVIAYSGEHFPAYQAITTTSAIDDNGKTLNVMIINKHQTHTIPVKLDLVGFAATSGQYWQVTGPSLAASNSPSDVQVRRTVDGQSLSSDQLKQVSLPPLSMTIIQLHR